VRKIQSIKAANESMRLLYVAATRARSHLHLLGHAEIDPKTNSVKEPASRTLLRKLWPAAVATFETVAEMQAPPVEADPAAIPQRPAGIPMRRLHSTWQPVDPPPDIRWQPLVATAVSSTVSGDEATLREHVSFEWASELPRHVGIVVHAMLQRAGEADIFEMRSSTIGAALSAQGLSGERLREATARVENALRQTLSDGRGRWIMATHFEDQREYSLCGVVEGRVRHFTLDRTFVDDNGIRWIIDYKTGPHEGGNLEAFLDSEEQRYRPQLENYRQLVSRLDTRPIRLGLYFPMLQAWREWA
jgi:ATP-dependent exoDNAse (exonuclease V) beta subunit